MVAETVTREDGSFQFDQLPTGPLWVRIEAAGFARYEAAVERARELRAVLWPERQVHQVTVTASRGGLLDAQTAAPVVGIADESRLHERAAVTTGNALETLPGIMVQQSTTAQSSPFLRGLTGYHVVHLIDGLRLNNSTFRSGPNQYLAFVDLSQTERVEAVLGPASAAFGSDALGGAIQVLTPRPNTMRKLHGDVLLAGASADLSAGASAKLSGKAGRFWWLAGGGLRHHNDLQAGRGEDSRNVFHRLFGMPAGDVRELGGARLTGSAFSQQSAEGKLSARLPAEQLVTAWYQWGKQEGVQGYKDLLGGLGRVQSRFLPQGLDFAYLRYEKLGLGALDSLSATLSHSGMDDGSLRQGLRVTDTITDDQNSVATWAQTLQGTMHLGRRHVILFGGEHYRDTIQAGRVLLDPVSGGSQTARPLYPDGSTYIYGSGFGEGHSELFSGRLRLTAGLRINGVRYSAPGIPTQNFGDIGWNASAAWRVQPWLQAHLLAGRAFRAPNLNDLGALGLNDLGYEIPASSAEGALMGSSAGENAVSLGKPVGPLEAERLMNYESGLILQARRLYVRANAFYALLSDPIVRRTLLYPAASPPASLAGLPVTPIEPTAEQRRQGVVAAATQFDPRAVKAFVNDGATRYYGTEAMGELSLGWRWHLRAAYSMIAGRDLNPNRNTRRLPPQQGLLSLRWTPTGRRPWVEMYASAAGAQRRLSGGDLDDERIGAARSRNDIAAFFNGSVAAPLVRNGVFIPTGETLAAIQDRVLPGAAPATRVPLYLSTAGWLSVGAVCGYPLRENVHVTAGVQNLLDHNYRIHGSGVDAPGLGAHVALRFSF